MTLERRARLRATRGRYAPILGEHHRVRHRFAWLLGDTETAHEQDNTVTAIDIALEPDATMVQHARADNARLLKDFPEGFALDATHHPHITMLQQFVRTADLDKVYSAAKQVLIKEDVQT